MVPADNTTVMRCSETPTTLRFLRGELSARASQTSLDHVRKCVACRETMRYAGATFGTSEAVDAMARCVEAAPGPLADADPTTAETPVSARRIGFSLLRPSGKKSVAGRVMMFALVGVVIMSAVRGLMGRGSAGAPTEWSPEELARRSLADGTPVVVSPQGAFEGRPRVVSALLPPGVDRGRVMIVDEGGRVVQDLAFMAGAGGCFVDDTEFRSEGGSFHAGRVTIPFPSLDSASVAPGATCGVVVSIAGGHVARSVTFHCGERAEPDSRR